MISIRTADLRPGDVLVGAPDQDMGLSVTVVGIGRETSPTAEGDVFIAVHTKELLTFHTTPQKKWYVERPASPVEIVNGMIVHAPVGTRFVRTDRNVWRELTGTVPFDRTGNYSDDEVRKYITKDWKVLYHPKVGS